MEIRNISNYRDNNNNYNWSDFLILYQQLNADQSLLKQDLGQNPPNWSKIQQDLSTMITDFTKMTQMAPSMRGASAKLLSGVLEPMANFIAEMKGEAADKNQEALSHTLGLFNTQMGPILQVILQG